MRPVRNVFQKLSCTEQRRQGVVAYLWLGDSPSRVQFMPMMSSKLCAELRAQNCGAGSCQCTVLEFFFFEPNIFSFLKPLFSAGVVQNNLIT